MTPHKMSNTWDQRQFDRALNACIQTSNRTAENVVNGHALRVAFGAQKFTPKADASKIGRELSELTEMFERQKSGRTIKRKILASNQAPIAALLVNKERGRRGEKGLYGSDMKYAVAHFIGFRKRSVAFLKSGWTPVIKILMRAVPSKYRPGVMPQAENEVKGLPNGSVILATIEKCACTISNDVGTRGPKSIEHNEALMKYGRPALQRAFDVETQQMIQHLKEKLDQESFAEFNRACV